MDEMTERRPGACVIATPELAGMNVAEGIELTGLLFLPTVIMPCCSQLALPYMAKVIGKIVNHSTEDVMVKVKVLLIDASGMDIGEGTDVLALDGNGQAEFEVRIAELREEVKKYRVAVEKTDESDPWFSE